MSKVKFLALLLIVTSISTLGIWIIQDPPGVTTINPARPPQDILEPEEMEKLRTLQNAKEVFLLGAISPDDSTVIVASGTEAGNGESDSKQAVWLDIQTGQSTPIDSKFLELFPQSEIAWTGHQTANYVSSNANGDPVLVTLERASGGLQTKDLQISGRPLSLAPNASRLLIEAQAKNGMELRVMDLESGTTRTLLNYAAGGTPQSFAWTADGSKLAFVRYMISDELAADQNQINEFVTQDALGKIPLEQNPMYNGNVVDILDLARDDFKLAALRASGGDGYLFKEVGWSPDGQRLLARMVRPSQPAGREHPVVVAGLFPDRSNYRFYDSDLNLIETLDRPEIEAPSASTAQFISTDEVILTAAHGLNFHLFYFNLQTGEFRRLPAAAGTFGEAPNGFQVYTTHQSRQLVYNQSSFQHPSEIYRLDLEGSAPQALSQYNAQATAANQIRVDEVSFQLGEDLVRTGYLLQPAGSAYPPKNVPIVIHHQGGPGGAMTNRWGTTSEDPFNLLPNFGISVLFMPFSGREGFGPEFYRALADGDHFGQIDVHEAALAARYLLDHGYADKSQIGVMGCSYGGYVTNQSITQYPELFAAASAGCSIMDLTNWWEQNPYMVDVYEGSLPSDRPEEYRRDSPLYNAHAVRTPLLLMHGTEDFLPVKLVREFWKEVNANETPVQLLVFKNEGHSLALPTSRSVAAQQQIAWFRKYLK